MKWEWGASPYTLKKKGYPFSVIDNGSQLPVFDHADQCRYIRSVVLFFFSGLC